MTDPTRPETFAPVDPRVLRAELLHIIGEAIADTPRSRQVEPGPSEVGTPCERRLAHKLLNTPPANRRAPAWRAAVGTAVHKELADILDAWNIANGFIERPRFLIEHRLHVGTYVAEDLEGSCDVFDTATLTAVDWKVPGPSTMKAARIAAARGECWDPQYEVQAQLYGRGWELKGYPVQAVAVVALPAAGELTDAVMWSAPYDRTIAEAALARLAKLKTVVAGLGPIAPSILPAFESHCEYCPAYSPGATDLTKACPGAPGLKTRPVFTDPRDLIAAG